MKLIKPSFEILTPIDRDSVLRSIELAGRTCYKSEDKITEYSASKFVRMIVARGHLSVIEHQSVSVKFICDRGVSHELVRHRLASFSQESTRYCNYATGKFDGELTFIIPPWLAIVPGSYTAAQIFEDIMRDVKEDSISDELIFIRDLYNAESSYVKKINQINHFTQKVDTRLRKWSPQEARSVLPNALKTEIVVTANLREWKEIFRQRCSPGAHPQMQELMNPLYVEFAKLLPEIYA